MEGEGLLAKKKGDSRDREGKAGHERKNKSLGEIEKKRKEGGSDRNGEREEKRRQREN